MKRKAIAGILAASFMLTPALRAQEQRKIVEIGPFCQLLLLINIYEILRMHDCEMQRRYNPPPIIRPGPWAPWFTNGTPPIDGLTASLGGFPVSSGDCSAYNWPDTNSGCTYTQFTSFVLQQAGEVAGPWTNWVRVNIWQSPAGAMDEVQGMDGATLAKGYATYDQTNILKLVPPLPDADRRFFRAVAQ